MREIERRLGRDGDRLKHLLAKDNGITIPRVSSVAKRQLSSLRAITTNIFHRGMKIVVMLYE